MTKLKLSFTVVPLTMMVCSLWVFVSKCKHLLNTLLSLEFIMLGILFVLMVCPVGGMETYFVLFFYQ